MRNKLLFCFFFLLFFAVPTKAHPLGNFSINNFSRLEIEIDQIRLRSVLDLAEIPTFQESQRIDQNKNNQLEDQELAAHLEKLTEQYLANLNLAVDGQPLRIQTATKKISLQTGAGNLPTLRAEWDFTAEIAPSAKDAIRSLRFENNNYKERVGWNEIVIRRGADTNVFDSTAFGSQLTDELKTYPEDLLATPLTERAAELRFAAANVSVNGKPLANRDGKTSQPIQKDRLAELISVSEITPAIVLLGLLVAFSLGAAHAMSPGHGKTVVGAYLVGSKGTIKHAAFLGLTVTVTHTLGVFALGIVTLFASQYVLPERIMPVLSFVSGLLVLFIGLSLFKTRLLAWLGHAPADSALHEHAHEDVYAHAHANQASAFTHTHDGHTHSHLPPESVTWRSLLTLGISGGLLPCPSALVLMLSAIHFNRIGYGLLLTLAFSLGLAATLMCIGLAFLYVGKVFDNPALSSNPIIKALPVFSAFVIACLGAIICYNSLA